MTKPLRLRAVKATAKGVAEEWKAVYGAAWRPGSGTASPSETIYQQLLALGDNPAIDDVARIVGKGWTHPCCDVCEEYVDAGIEIATEEDVVLCRSCLREAMRMLTEAGGI